MYNPIQEQQKQRSNLRRPTNLGTEGTDRWIHVKPLLPLQNPCQIEESEAIYFPDPNRTCIPAPPSRTRAGSSHLELGLQLLPLEPRGDGHDVLHLRRLVLCSTPTQPPTAPISAGPPPGNRDPGIRDPYLRGAGWCGGRRRPPRRAARRGLQRRRAPRGPRQRRRLPCARRGLGCAGGATWW